ncbi:MAG TPA: hypothetical protein VE961_09090 [Pyrinomonadaceae bacterium]|nr:hypothetical protein [Pyrinomonadaceae bacterium]
MNVYVSLTTIKQNETTVGETLQSLTAQTQLPDKCFIFLSEDPYLLDPGFTGGTIDQRLSQFMKANPLFEPRWCLNTGPFRKLLPLLEEKFDEDCLIVTIDDDTVYAPTFLEKIVDDFRRYECCVGNWALTLRHSGELRGLNYENFVRPIPRSLYNFHLGKGGVVYHPSFFKKTRAIMFDDELIKATCPTADDVWFNFMRIANGISCYSANAPFMTKDNTNTQTGLWWNFNAINRTNSKYMRATIDLLISAGLL